MIHQDTCKKAKGSWSQGCPDLFKSDCTIACPQGGILYRGKKQHISYTCAIDGTGVTWKVGKNKFSGSVDDVCKKATCYMTSDKGSARSIENTVDITDSEKKNQTSTQNKYVKRTFAGGVTKCTGEGKCYFKCAPGYKKYINGSPSSSKFISCPYSINKAFPSAECKITGCETKDNKVKNATFKCSSVKFNDKCELTCNTGYRLKDPSLSIHKCFQNGKKLCPDKGGCNKNVVCENIKCSRPKQNDGYKNPPVTLNYTGGTGISCSNSYITDGKATMSCVATGVYTATDGWKNSDYVLKGCKEGLCKESSWKGFNNTKTSIDNKKVGEKQTLDCKTGYRSSNKDTNKTTVTCTKASKTSVAFKGKFCNVTKCKAVASNGKFKKCGDARNETAYNKRCDISCTGGYTAATATFRCYVEKDKNEMKPIKGKGCVPKTCQKSVSLPIHSKGYGSCKNYHNKGKLNMVHKQKCSISCADRYMVKGEITCDDGVMKGSSSCELIPCGGPQKIYNTDVVDKSKRSSYRKYSKGVTICETSSPKNSRCYFKCKKNYTAFVNDKKVNSQEGSIICGGEPAKYSRGECICRHDISKGLKNVKNSKFICNPTCYVQCKNGYTLSKAEAGKQPYLCGDKGMKTSRNISFTCATAKCVNPENELKKNNINVIPGFRLDQIDYNMGVQCKEGYSYKQDKRYNEIITSLTTCGVKGNTECRTKTGHCNYDRYWNVDHKKCYMIKPFEGDACEKAGHIWRNDKCIEVINANTEQKCNKAKGYWNYGKCLKFVKNQNKDTCNTSPRIPVCEGCPNVDLKKPNSCKGDISCANPLRPYCTNGKCTVSPANRRKDHDIAKDYCGVNYTEYRKEQLIPTYLYVSSIKQGNINGKDYLPTAKNNKGAGEKWNTYNMFDGIYILETGTGITSKGVWIPPKYTRVPDFLNRLCGRTFKDKQADSFIQFNHRGKGISGPKTHSGYWSIITTSNDVYIQEKPLNLKKGDSKKYKKKKWSIFRFPNKSDNYSDLSPITIKQQNNTVSKGLNEMNGWIMNSLHNGITINRNLQRSNNYNVDVSIIPITSEASFKQIKDVLKCYDDVGAEEKKLLRII